jgi:hypothetical protein
MTRSELPPRARVVGDIDELLIRRFDDDKNALCLPRAEAPDMILGFDELARLVARDIDDEAGAVDVDVDRLWALPLSANARQAAHRLRADLEALWAHGRQPALSCIRRYATDTRGLPIATDVLSFHVDRAPVEVDTFLCTYAGAASEIVDNDVADRLIDDPTIRRALRAALGGNATDVDSDVDVTLGDDSDFARLIADGSFDLHYRPRHGARVFSCGRFWLWKLAVTWPGSRVLPCIHRAPRTSLHDSPRLLLIA